VSLTSLSSSPSPFSATRLIGAANTKTPSWLSEALLQTPDSAQSIPRWEGLVQTPEGLNLWVEEMGEGPAVLLVAGLGYGTWYWRDLQAQLAQAGYRAITLDNRGGGRSDKPEGPYSIEQMADDAQAVLAALGVEQAHVIGHSMGGYIAQTIAGKYPDAVKSLTLMGTSRGGADTLPVPPETEAYWAQAKADIAADFASQGREPTAEEFTAEFARRTMHLAYADGWTEANAERFEQHLAARLEFPTPDASRNAQKVAADAFVANGLSLIGAQTSDLEQPALVIHGTGDRILPVENGQLLSEALPNDEYLVLEGSGHNSALDEPERVTAEVLEHLDQVEQDMQLAR
jgi:pimeloyl-ACP methyl ester carboxylesterase